LIAENMFWKQVDDEYLRSIPEDRFSITYEVEIEGRKYKVTINALKIERPEK